MLARLAVFVLFVSASRCDALNSNSESHLSAFAGDDPADAGIKALMEVKHDSHASVVKKNFKEAFAWVNGAMFSVLILVIYRVITVTPPESGVNVTDDKSITEVLPIILLWAALGMAIICTNKVVFLPPGEGGFGFPCPLALTCVQMIVGVVMTNIIKFVRPQLMPAVAAGGITLHQFFTAVVPVGVIFAAYLSIGNSAYLYLSVPFVQMLKSAGPIAVHVIACGAGLERLTMSSITTVFIIAVGVLGTCVGEVTFSWLGFGLQLIAFVLDGCRLVMLKSLMTTGNKLDPISGLYYYSPVCVLALAGPAAYFEGPKLLPILATAHPWLPCVLILNGLNAFALNFSILMLFKRASATTVSVASVVRDFILTFGSALFFRTNISMGQVLGYLSACIGVKLWDQLKTRPQAFETAFIKPAKLLCGMKGPSAKSVV